MEEPIKLFTFLPDTVVGIFREGNHTLDFHGCQRCGHNRRNQGVVGRGIENLRVAALARTAEALGGQEILLCGYTPTPKQEKIKKTTMGTEAWIPWRAIESTEQAISELKALGFRLIGLETSPKAEPITETFFHAPTAFVFGNERFGLSLSTLQLCDELRRIELSGQKNSLNVAHCGAIVCHEWIRQWLITT